MPANPAWNGSTIIHETAMTFDPGDALNGSLYLCQPQGESQMMPATIGEAIALLRAHSLWSAEQPKSVRDEQKAAYEAQLKFVEACELTRGGAKLVLARFDHPKFPSSAERFNAWRKALQE